MSTSFFMVKDNSNDRLFQNLWNATFPVSSDGKLPCDNSFVQVLLYKNVNVIPSFEVDKSFCNFMKLRVVI